MSTDRTEMPRAASDVGRWDVETDVLVVGYGCAGASAAFEAARAGAEVVVLERASAGGGSSALAGGEIYLGGGTSVQRACGFDDDAEEMAKFLMAALGPDADRAKVTLYAEQSVSHFEWLVERGVPFKPSLWDSPTWVPPTDDGLMWMGENSWPFTEIATPAPRGHRPTSNDFGGWLLMERLTTAVAAVGADVRCDSYVTNLVVGPGGEVVGAVARRYGTEYTVRARRGVVLTTGGFVDNEEMLALHAPQLVGHDKNSDGSDDGRGILMAQAVGAAVKHMSAGQIGISLIPGMIARGMIVNGQGQRFVNEDTYPGLVGQAALYRQGMDVWVIVDEQGYDDVPEPERWGVRPHHVAGTPEELADLIGIPPSGLRTTIDLYNEHAARGEDPFFRKSARWLRPLTPPFAAIDVRMGLRPPSEAGSGRSSGASVFTLGGLHTTVDGEVLDLDARPVPGLFAAGRATSGLHSWGYISGTSLGDGTFFGRRAGLAAARTIH
ncbi:FAD-dependent oxidoreductase [Pseudonocardia nigra]|uniref:FAD-dependent oxidoreductase n=1 Tax=Pseudonocardia nigra TaxID=1921578 RepID=UPI001C6077EC|nr:FAD-dependent oxidoreductase [Pseudonocardia nigra]